MAVSEKYPENDLLALLRKELFFGSDFRVVHGIGDDAAVLRFGTQWMVAASDMLLEGTHFKLDWGPPSTWIQKAFLVNASDMAAMGAVPKYALLNLGIPKNICLKKEMKMMVHSIRRIAEHLQCQVIGGDLAASSRFFISIAMIGELEKRKFKLRSGARVGDHVYVSGVLGHSALGCSLLLENASGQKIEKKRTRAYMNRHCFPPNRVSLGHSLAKIKSVHAMMDLSDGLLKDLDRLLRESRCGAVIDEKQLPCGRFFYKDAKQSGKNPLDLILGGGEDYELLWTASPKYVFPGSIDGTKITRIGEVVGKEKGLCLLDRQLRRISRKIPTYEHF